MTPKKLLLIAGITIGLIFSGLILLVLLNRESPENQTTEIPSDHIHGRGTPELPQAPPTGDIDKLEEFLHANPDDVQHLQLLADLYASKQNPKSRPLFRKLIALNQSVADNWVALGQTFDFSVSPDSVLLCNRKALLADPKNPKALYNLGAIAANSGDTKKALDYWHRVDLSRADGEVNELVTNGLKVLEGGK